jgi:hypothetical protein
MRLGYVEHLKAITDPNQEQHDELLEWRGPFNSEDFDAAKRIRRDEINRMKVRHASSL